MGSEKNTHIIYYDKLAKSHGMVKQKVETATMSFRPFGKFSYSNIGQRTRFLNRVRGDSFFRLFCEFID